MKTGIELIAEKRAKHESKGWTLEHDMTHQYGALAIMAADLALRHTDESISFREDVVPDWHIESENTIDRLAIAGSLIAAEIDRLQAKGDSIKAKGAK